MKERGRIPQCLKCVDAAPLPMLLQLFLQIKGNMVLKVVERNQHRDIVIKEGEVKIHIL